MTEHTKEPMKSAETAKATLKNLTSEQKEGEARRSLWAEGMRLLNENGVNYSSLKSSKKNCVWLAVARGEYIEKDSDYGNRGIDLKIEVLRREFDESKGLHRAPTIEIFLFNPDKTIGVLKEIYKYPDFGKREATSHSRKIESRQATVGELEDLLKNVRASRETEVKIRQNQEQPASLGLEEAQEAREMARKTWAKATKLSEGESWDWSTMKNVNDQEWVTVEIFGTNLLKKWGEIEKNDEGSIRDLIVNVIIKKPDSSSRNENYVFYKNGQVIRTADRESPDGKWIKESREANAQDLKSLLDIVNQCAEDRRATEQEIIGQKNRLD